jgi:hypothetical protein
MLSLPASGVAGHTELRLREDVSELEFWIHWKGNAEDFANGMRTLLRALNKYNKMTPSLHFLAISAVLDTFGKQSIFELGAGLQSWPCTTKQTKCLKQVHEASY